MKKYFYATLLGFCFGPIGILWLMAIPAAIANILSSSSGLLGDYPVFVSTILVVGGAIGLFGIGAVFRIISDDLKVKKRSFYKYKICIFIGLSSLWYGLYPEIGLSLKAVLLLYFPTGCALYFLYIYLIKHQSHNKVV